MYAPQSPPFSIAFLVNPNIQMTEAEKSRENQWDQVDDFKWLKVGQSPHWEILPEELRLDEHAWTKTVPGRPGASVNETLAKVGIPRK